MDMYRHIQLILCLSEVFLFATGVEPEMDVREVNVTVVEGTTAVLPCSIENLGDYKVVWIDFGGYLLSISDRRIIDDHRISVERPYIQDWNLHIRNVLYSDQGIYSCQINTNPVTSKTVNLEVKVPTKILEELSSSDQTVNEGETLLLVCNTTGVPKPDVVWFKRSGKTGASQEIRLENTGKVLSIANVSRYDRGIYTCTGYNGVPPVVSRSMKVEVFSIGVEPEMDVREVNVTVVEGTTAVLPCSIENLGDHKVVWTNFWGTLLTYFDRRITDDDRIRVERPYIQDWNLYIRDVLYSDQGKYTCQIDTNPVKSTTVNLKVKVPPKILDELSSSDQTVNEGETLLLVCNTTGVPEPDVVWSIRPGKTGASQEIRLENTGEVLRIANVSRYDHGTYTCTGYNGVPPDVSRRMKVEVFFPPEIFTPVVRMRQYSGKETILDCDITAHPFAVVYWKHNDTGVVQSQKHQVDLYNAESYRIVSLRIQDLSFDDSGRYTCHAVNMVGEAEASTELTVLHVPTKSTPLTTEALTDMTLVLHVPTKSTPVTTEALTDITSDTSDVEATTQLVPVITEEQTDNNENATSETNDVPSREKIDNEVLKAKRLEYYRERILTDRKRRRMLDLQETYYRSVIRYLQKYTALEEEVTLTMMCP